MDRFSTEMQLSKQQQLNGLLYFNHYQNAPDMNFYQMYSPPSNSEQQFNFQSSNQVHWNPYPYYYYGTDRSIHYGIYYCTGNHGMNNLPTSQQRLNQDLLSNPQCLIGSSVPNPNVIGHGVGDNAMNNFPSPTSTNETTGLPSSNPENELPLSAKINIKLHQVLCFCFPFVDKTEHKIVYDKGKKSKGDMLISIDYSDVLKNFPEIEWVIVSVIQDTTNEVEYYLEGLTTSNELIIFPRTNFKGKYTTILSFFDENLDERFRTSFKLNDSKERRRIIEKILKDKKVKAIHTLIEYFEMNPEETLIGDIFDLLSTKMCEALEEKSEEKENKKDKESEKEAKCKNKIQRKRLENEIEKLEEEIKSLKMIIYKIRYLENKTFGSIKDTIYNGVNSVDTGNEFLICCFDELINIILERNLHHPIFVQFLKDCHQCEGKKIEIKFSSIEKFIEEHPNEPLHLSILIALINVIESGKIKNWKLEEEEIKELQGMRSNPLNSYYGHFKENIFNIFFNIENYENLEKGKELLTYCFDEFYTLLDENKLVEIDPIYIPFLKEYFIGNYNNNTIVITMEDKDFDNEFQLRLRKRKNSACHSDHHGVESRRGRKKQRVLDRTPPPGFDIM